MHYLFLILAIVFVSCNQGQNQVNQPKASDSVQTQVVVPEFNPDSAYQFLKQQVDFGPRVPGTGAHAQCADFLYQKLSAYSDTVIIQTAPISTFDGKTFQLKNIVASFNPQTADRILLCAHWDTRPWADADSIDPYQPIDGADDGASGVAVLLELARIMKLNRPSQGVDIVLFDLEDYGQEQNDKRYPYKENTWCMGSQYWARHAHKPGYSAQYGILLDMVGAGNAVFPMEGTSQQYAPAQLKSIWDLANRLGYSSYFTYAQTNPTIDDHLYVNTLANIPCIDIVHYRVENSHYAPHHHRHSDNLTIIDKKTLGVVGTVVIHAIFTTAI